MMEVTRRVDMRGVRRWFDRIWALSDNLVADFVIGFGDSGQMKSEGYLRTMDLYVTETNTAVT
jgi:hypothetical protein